MTGHASRTQILMDFDANETIYAAHSAATADKRESVSRVPAQAVQLRSFTTRHDYS